MNVTIAKKSLMRACRQLEICGYCPKEEYNRISEMYDNCPIAQKQGTYGCHNCIRKHFVKEATDFESSLS